MSVNVTVLVETASGAQLLPPIEDVRAIRSAYVAHLAADADMRTKFPLYRKIASELSVVMLP